MDGNSMMAPLTATGSPNDEDHGICTQDDMLLDALEMAPANFISPGVT
jgi:hypothetical protein